ncbi:MAG: hypothetical protein HN744_02465 [Halieaceae bacterium]|jgi:hypothetical protein|nr:hypothetical protein [Halieaceae bacterium]
MGQDSLSLPGAGRVDRVNGMEKTINWVRTMKTSLAELIVDDLGNMFPRVGADA